MQLVFLEKTGAINCMITKDRGNDAVVLGGNNVYATNLMKQRCQISNDNNNRPIKGNMVYESPMLMEVQDSNTENVFQ